MINLDVRKFSVLRTMVVVQITVAEVEPELLEEQVIVVVEVEPGDTQVPWEEVDPNSDEVTPIFPFTEPVGPVRRLPDQSTPFEFYSLIVDRSVVEILVTETNK